MINIIFLILGFAMLVKGADWLVDGASSIAQRLKISNLVIGLTLVAIGTSAPELAVSIFGSTAGAGDVVFGNIIGSNIANFLLIVGSAAMSHTLIVHKATAWKEIPLGLLSILVVGLMANDVFLDNDTVNTISRVDGLILLSFFMIFIYYIGSVIVTTDGETVKELEEEHDLLSWKKSLIMVVVGLSGLIIGGRLVVDEAIWLARFFDLSENFIGLTVVAIGTSLPELVTSITASFKKNFDLAMGNVVGSNIINIFFILGLSATIRPLTVPAMINSDLIVATVASLILLISISLSGQSTFLGKRYEISRGQGVLFVIIYFSYLTFLFYRG